MGGKMCPKIILEGTRLTMKTEIAFALNEHPRVVGPKKYRYHSPLISAEWCSFTNYPWGKGPINFDPADEELAMEVYRTWARMFELQKYYSWIIDRFHISTMAYQSARNGKKYDFGWLEDRLLPLEFRLVFMKRSEDSFESAREERLKISGKPSQYDDLEIFKREQKQIEELISKSKLKSLAVDISDGNVSRAVEDIADWLERTGGIYLES
jgi:hypothetical protein